jgi:DNA helicase-2/ATP-dependent DNA helicase PcrA
VLTNKLVAELSGFQDVYACFSSTSYYKKYYDRINTELLSNELSKLGEIPSLIYKILDLEVAIKEPSTALTTVFNEEILSNLTWRALQRLIKHLKSFSGATLREYVNSIFEIYAKSEKGDFVKGLVRTLFDLNSYTFNDFYIYMLDRLYPNLDSDDNEKIEEANKILCDLIDIDLSQYALWYRFINNLDDTGVVYHTYHGTKGLEFDNVVIVMENDFGRMNKNMFSTYFKNVAHPDKVLKENELLKHENTKNLFYVSCSRSIKNLRILYLDDTSSFQDGINHIFGESHAF